MLKVDDLDSASMALVQLALNFVKVAERAWILPCTISDEVFLLGSRSRRPGLQNGMSLPVPNGKGRLDVIFLLTMIVPLVCILSVFLPPARVRRGNFVLSETTLAEVHCGNDACWTLEGVAVDVGKDFCGSVSLGTRVASVD